MNDDDLTTNAELASAYLDGELDATERADVSDDPTTMALVRSFDRVRTELRSAVPIDDTARTSALAAALSEFDSVHSSAAPQVAATPATVTTLRSHRRVRAYRVIQGLAAASIVVVVGLAALNASRGNDTPSSASERTLAANASPAAESPVLKSTESASGGATAATSAPAATIAAAADSSAGGLPTIDSADALTEYVAGFELGRNAAPAAGVPAPAPSSTTPAASQAATADQTSAVQALPACIPAEPHGHRRRDHLSGHTGVRRSRLANGSIARHRRGRLPGADCRFAVTTRRPRPRYSAVGSAPCRVIR